MPAATLAGMVGTSDDTARAELSERDREMLDFERQRWKYAGAKEAAVRDRFDMTLTRYYQVVNQLLDHPGALEYDPQLVGRLRRIRDGRRDQRSARRAGPDVEV